MKIVFLLPCKKAYREVWIKQKLAYFPHLPLENIWFMIIYQVQSHYSCFSKFVFLIHFLLTFLKCGLHFKKVMKKNSMSSPSKFIIMELVINRKLDLLREDVWKKVQWSCNEWEKVKRYLYIWNYFFHLVIIKCLNC